jgi:hypothetical protein
VGQQLLVRRRIDNESSAVAVAGQREAAGDPLAEQRERGTVTLAFVAPRVIAAIADGSVAGYATVTGLAQRLPDSWAEQERRHKV